MQIKYYKASDLIEAEYNPRKLTKEAEKHLSDSLKRFGLVDPVLINVNPERKNIIIGGHQRVKIATKLGIKEIPCVELDLTLEKEKELNIRLNKNTGAFDEDLLQEYFEKEHLIEFGFDASEIEFFNIEEIENEGLTDPDEVPEAPKDPITKPGDLYILGNHRLLCGDSTNPQHIERLMDGKKADITLTSPPYNAAKNGHLKGKIKGFESKYERSEDAMSDTDYLGLIYGATVQAINVSRYSFINLQLLAHNKKVILQYQFDLSRYLKDILIWNKKTAPPNIVKGAFNTKFEFVYVFSSDNETRGFPCSWQGKYSNVIETENNSSNQYAKDHRAGFPVVFPQWFIDRLDFVKSIYEPFCGTGTTLIAAQQNNLICYGIELDPAYCDVIVKRWEDFTGKKAELQKGEE